MSSRLILIIFFLRAVSVSAQENVDSLKALFVASGEKVIKADLADELGSRYAYSKRDSSIYYFDFAADLWLDLGDTLKFLQSAQYARTQLVEDKKYDRAIRNLSRIIPFFSKNTDLGHSYLELVSHLSQSEDTELQVDLLHSAIFLFEQEKDTFCMLMSYDLIAKNYQDLGAPDSALFYIRKALEIEDVNSYPLSSIYEKLSVLQLLRGDSTEAVNSLTKAINIKRQLGSGEGMAKFFVRLGELLKGQGNVGLAFEKVDSAKLLASKNKELEPMAEALKLEAALWDIQNDYQRAYRSYKAYTELEDSLILSSPSAFENETQFNLFRQRREIENARLALLLEKSTSEVEEQKLWIVLLAITLLISFFISVRYIRTLKKSRWAYAQLQESNRKVLAQSRELSLAQEEIVKSEKMAFLGRIFAGIGHELNTPIAAVKSNLQLIEDAQMQEIKKFKDLSEYITPQTIRICIELVIASYQSQLRPISTNKQRQLKRELADFFEQRKPDIAFELIDIFDDLKIYFDLEKFDELYDHPQCIPFLELATFISTRTRSIMTAMEALKRADKILFSLKTYSFKNLDDTKTTFDLVRNINTILTLHQNKLKDITIYKQFDDEVQIEGYPDELTQVWTNLISNASYANGYKGNLWIRIRQYDNEVRVEFEDSGGGIDPAVKEQIFEPFETTKPEGEGSGLGLSISKKVIEKHNGNITVENTPSGALFTVSLPRN